MKIYKWNENKEEKKNCNIPHLKKKNEFKIKYTQQKCILYGNIHYLFFIIDCSVHMKI